ncbi:hypothetical protein CPC735_052850 [Coccidioides posadasii C735 delta SOWgp]|uniref:Aminoglycoside phosphotransferase domain-containing protein n=1 Tax=Coccidioides posadasii (strain C735) TaxID=222929 RepID=C5PHB2_COCP7|nr:hypothetical protein CPC735_052850 [Coccidioides posadasii C735 delta SOWgp]EER23915.1 hypothetical protein CPC735_052850 [Coccidioides posadasii C735 delta SOWgp]|eukprot:XP_003066060.1 hypothetical protein CPC735_052850 [Coccidioides posadasii C735 delta SOWgp]
MKMPFLARPYLLSAAVRRILHPPSAGMATNAPGKDSQLFEYTRGRFLLDEDKQMARRRVQFSLDGLASVAATSVGANRCIPTTMDNGKEVIAKIPNPNAGIPYYTTASEVATMDFARNILQTPAPHVYAWNARVDERNSVGAEYIVMEKMPGVPLSKVWWDLQPNKKLKILLQVVDYQRRWTHTKFTGFGSLYYAKDVDPRRQDPLYVKDGEAVTDSQFAIGPSVAREWSDEGRVNIKCDRGPWDCILDYREAIGLREMAAIKELNHVPKQMAMVYGPTPLYQPTAQKKLAALGYYFQILESLLCENALPTDGHLWHNDLHHENIFVDPEELKVLGIIDWQSVQIAPLFDHCVDPCFLDYNGPDVGDNLGRPAMPESIKSLQGEEKTAALNEFLDKALMIAWRSLVRSKNPEQYRMIRFQQSPSANLLHLSRRIFELGEAHFCVLLLDLQDEWRENSQSNSSARRFPLTFSEPETIEIEADMRRADLGIKLMKDIERDLRNLWPQKGVVEHESYEQVKALLKERKEELIAQYCTLPGWDTAVFEQLWPFDD